MYEPLDEEVNEVDEMEEVEEMEIVEEMDEQHAPPSDGDEAESGDDAVYILGLTFIPAIRMV